MHNNNLQSEPVPDSLGGCASDIRRCQAVRHGQRCLRKPGHQGQHMATIGSFMRWDGQATLEELAERGSSALLWVAWARALGVDAVAMQVQLLDICDQTNSHPSDLLFNLFELPASPAPR